MYCKNCGHENDEDATFCENCGANLGSTSPQETSAGMSKINKILIVAVIVLVLGIGISAGMLFTGKELIANNTTPQSNNTSQINTSTVNQTTTTRKTENTATEITTGKDVDLSGYTLTDVRDASEGLQQCKFCKKWDVSRIVYEYHNSAGDRIMIGENTCNICGKTWRDMWQNGEWFDI